MALYAANTTATGELIVELLTNGVVAGILGGMYADSIRNGPVVCQCDLFSTNISVSLQCGNALATQGMTNFSLTLTMTPLQ